MSKTVWEKLNDSQKDELMQFNKEYIDFLSVSKTERAFVNNSIALVEKAGFKNLSEVTELKPGDKVYSTNKGKNILAFIIGKEPIRNGLNLLGAHIDSPRTDLKQHPLYESNGLVLLDTHYYGGIKKYQWVARPMALVGVVVKKDGTVIDINIGDDDNDPVVGISDLLIHLAADQMSKTGAKVVEGEALDVLVGSIPKKDTEKDPVKAYILDLLKEKYDIEEDDFISSEIEVVPAGKARDYGLDRSMVMGYGHDDKVCAYTSLRAVLDFEGTPDRTACAILVDKEEIGSVGNTGMQSAYFDHVIAKMLAMQNESSLVAFNDTMDNSRMLSSDVSAAFDPLYPEVMETKNASFFGKGICFNKYTGSRGKGGSNDANAEYMAKIRKIMDENDCYFQTCELGKVDVGGGGTIAYIMANKNMDVIDAGIAVQNMHAPCEVVSKADVYEAYRAYIAFLKDMD
ncbi:aminopeptidase [Bulleidia sp. HCP3S3_F2]|jgi:aspartyl aminopeptidase|uniref:aminopeptidase n=1 Tax=unclassified Bulleidia TaxID=2704656 RepID=UPI002A858961|nr:aminopeptidase [Erysipelotrichaceae bacterium]MDD7058085.1 aminopeptidase [Erysipelotrichaceae bacterium]MDY3660919.1 aminopeptidase [Bulleidia sp.]MEE1400206.1 aminopeptidase [Bulleidia sp.]